MHRCGCNKPGKALHYVHLTPKVTTCLELLAHGRRPAEIGDQLGLSVHTVRKHLNRAVDDLSCLTKAEAITRALALGLMFKILILQTLYTLSDDATEFQIRDRLSFMRFLGLGFEDAVPDAKTVWLFREHLTRAGAIDELFAAFDAWLKGKGYLAMSGQIIDASIIAAPRQRNTDAEKADLKEGRIPEAWAAKPKKLAQKDRDARWTLKRAKARAAKADGTKARVEIAVPMFGYKTHVSIDRKHGFIRRFTVTSAAAHDGAQMANVLDLANTASDVWADTAYRSKANEVHLAQHGRRSKIHFRRQPGLDLTAPQRKANRARSKVRSAVETVFAGQKHRFGLFVRTIGLARARTKIGLANLAYNLKRFLWTKARPVVA